MSPGKKPRVKKDPPPPTPKAPQPWDIPPPPDNGDATEVAVYKAVGHALSNWERLENQMSNIFAQLVDPYGSQNAARYAYGAVLASSVRADMLDGAAHAYFSPLLTVQNEKMLTRFINLKTKLDEIILHVGKFAARRNNIAHGVVSIYFSNSPEGAGYCLVPPLYATKHYRKTLVYPYAFTAETINGFAVHFYRLGERAHRFALKLVPTSSRTDPRASVPQDRATQAAGER